MRPVRLTFSRATFDGLSIQPVHLVFAGFGSATDPLPIEINAFPMLILVLVRVKALDCFTSS